MVVVVKLRQTCTIAVLHGTFTEMVATLRHGGGAGDPGASAVSVVVAVAVTTTATMASSMAAGVVFWRYQVVGEFTGTRMVMFDTAALALRGVDGHARHWWRWRLKRHDDCQCQSEPSANEMKHGRRARASQSLPRANAAAQQRSKADRAPIRRVLWQSSSRQHQVQL